MFRFNSVTLQGIGCLFHSHTAPVPACHTTLRAPPTLWPVPRSEGGRLESVPRSRGCDHRGPRLPPSNPPPNTHRTTDDQECRTVWGYSMGTMTSTTTEAPSRRHQNRGEEGRRVNVSPPTRTHPRQSGLSSIVTVHCTGDSKATGDKGGTGKTGT